MLSSLAGFDWWVLVIIPIVVTLFTTYLQKFLEWVGGRSFRRLNRYSLRGQTFRCTRVLERVVDHTWHMYYQQLIWKLTVAGIVGMISLAAARLPGSSSSSPCDVGLTTVQLVTGYLAFGVMMAASTTCGLIIALLDDYYKIAARPISAVTRLHKRLSKQPGSQLDMELELAMRLALRIQHVRDERLRAARAEWSPEEVQQHEKRLARIRQG